MISTALIISLVVSTTCGIAAHWHVEGHPEEVVRGERHVHLAVSQHRHSHPTHNRGEFHENQIGRDHQQTPCNHASHCLPVVATELLINAVNDKPNSMQASMGLPLLRLPASAIHAATDFTGSNSRFPRGASYFQRTCVVRC